MNICRQDLIMFSKYYGDKDLVSNEGFWGDAFLNYQNFTIPLPLVDTPESRRRLKDMFSCPKGKCSMCCREYIRVPVGDMDIKRLGDEFVKEDKDGKFLDTSKGCPYLVEGVCSVYEKRPDTCAQFPVQKSREAFVGDTKIAQMQYRLKCIPALNVIRELMVEACQGNVILMPDLNLIQKEII
jgi:Fe-S-cluster containining protein